MYSRHHVDRDLVSFSDNGYCKPVSRVTLRLDDEKVVTAGNDTGYELSADCPYATQEMADAILMANNGYVYQTFEAVAAKIDPAAELGDGIFADGHYGTIARIDDDGSGYPTISANGEVVVEDEYPQEGPAEQKFNRKITETRSLIEKRAEEIRLAVFGDGESGGIEASIQIKLDAITGKIEGVDDKYSTVAQTIEGLTVTTEDGTTKIKGGSIETKDLKVDAANITGTLKANQIDASDLKVDAANITGELVIGEQLPENLATTDKIPTKVGDLENDQKYATATGVVSIINGTVNADYVNALGVKAKYLQGEYVYLKDDSETTGGEISITKAQTADCAVDLTSYGALRLAAWRGDFFAQNGSGQYLHLQSSTGTVTVGGGDLIPNASGMYTCGTKSFSWSDVYIGGQSLNTLLGNLDERITALEGSTT